MSLNVSRPVLLELKPDPTVLATIATLGVAAGVAAVLAPLGVCLRLALALLIFAICLQAAAEQRFGHGRRALRHAALVAASDWRLELAAGQQCATRHLASSMRIGRWWFLRWPEGWAVVSPRTAGERAWRRLSARLRDPVPIRG